MRYWAINKAGQYSLYLLLFGFFLPLGSYAQRCANQASTMRPLTESTALEFREELRVPVVFHVVWHQPADSLSEEQLLSQLDDLNRDFNAQNEEYDQFALQIRNNSAPADIRFCLAQRDPDGLPTTGITYTQSPIPLIGGLKFNGDWAICFDSLGGKDAWNPSEYINIWIGPRTDACGQANGPEEAGTPQDGIRLDTDCVGSTPNVAPPYNLGRTLVHEMGHYLGLVHPWGEGIENDEDCTGDDGLDDTPFQDGSFYQECPAIGISHFAFNCALQNGNKPMMTGNFMNFTDDACMGQFSVDQVQLMRQVLQNERASLLNSSACEMVNTTPPPTFPRLQWTWNASGLSIWSEAPTNEELSLHLYTLQGQLLYQSLAQKLPLTQPWTPAVPGIYLLQIGNKSQVQTIKLYYM